MMAKDNQERKEYLDAWRTTNKEKVNNYHKTYREKNAEKVKARGKAWYEANKELTIQRSKLSAESRADELKEYRKKYHLANKDKVSERSKKWRAANHEKDLANSKEWRKANRAHSNALSSRRRARRRNAIPPALRNCPIENKRLIDIVKLRDVVTIVTGIEHHVDHMWPLDADGPHWSGNLQIITAEENLRKGAKVDPQIKEAIKHSLEVFLKDYKK